MSEMAHQYELFFNVTPDLLCIAGYDGYFKKVNPAVVNLLEYSLEELYASPINTFVHPEDMPKTAEVRHELTKARPLYNFENRYITKSGKTVWLSWTSYPVEDEQLIFAIAKNITHKKKLDNDRSELLARLSHVNKDLQTLSYTTSHNLRTPVNNLLSGLDLLTDSAEYDTETSELINILKLSGGFLKKTLDHYVDAITENNRLISGIETININESLQSVCSSIQALLQTSKAVLRTDFSAFSNIQFNHAYMESILLNLLSNSIKYARADRNPEIDIVTTISNGKKQLVYKDNGIGIDLNQHRSKLFHPGQSFHNNNDSKGIGLYLVHSHITDMGGSIDVESEVNNGTTFTITFL